MDGLLAPHPCHLSHGRGCCIDGEVEGIAVATESHVVSKHTIFSYITSTHPPTPSPSYKISNPH